VDEAGVRTLLGQLADTEPPPARIDLDAAIAAGRRGRRWRWIRLGGSALLAAAAAAVVAALLVAPAQRPGHQAADGTVAPTRFSVLVPYASFGWLPPGFHAGAAGGTMPRTIPGQLLLIAVSRSAFFETQVYPAGRCHLAGKALLCSTFDSMNSVLSRAPDVHGRRAYWLREGGLAWEYAPGAWSILDWWFANVPWPPTGAERAAVLRVAAGVRYGQTTPIRFPYWFSGLPAGSRVSEVDYTLLAGQPVVQTLHLYAGPVADAGPAQVGDLQVFASPAAHSDWSCPRGIGQHVTVDGVAAVLVVQQGAVPQEQLCIPDWRGLRVEFLLAIRPNAPAPSPTGPHGVLAYARAAPARPRSGGLDS
jgi:hypothetical protein